MQVKNLLTGIVAFAGIVAFGAQAGADVFQWNGSQSTSWGVGANWTLISGSGNRRLPDSIDDQAIIPFGSSFTVDVNTTDRVVGYLEIAKDAKLRIANTASAKLTVDAGNSSPTQTGQMVLKADGSASAWVEIGGSGTTGKLVFGYNNSISNQHLIGGLIELMNLHSELQITNSNAVFAPYYDGTADRYGFVMGDDDSAKLTIANGLTFTNRITLEGQMFVNSGGTATLDNHMSTASDMATIRANVSGGTFEIDSSVVLVDAKYTGGGTFRPLYEAVGSGSPVLKFSGNAGQSTALEGAFSVNQCGAKLRFDASVTTNGSLTHHVGTIDASSGSLITSNYNSGSFTQPDVGGGC